MWYSFQKHCPQPTVQVRHAGRQQEQPDKETFFFGRRLAQPGRDDRDEQVDADQRVHEPQVSGQRREVQEYPRQVFERGCSVDLPPQHRQGAIKYHEYEKRRQDADATPAVELPHGLPFLHRCKKKSGDYYKQWHGHTRETVVHRHP